ncbi:hypothetical protein JYB87_03975 [Shewanella avicenniae]|uniref:Esterase-like activity of phytase n=1 Tax=Shewanella avicenniae TaxID=2814294 RepID=A0ABX7QSN2_9GAMM|nr:hypothetical protein [Shewanella avicenniae]QSX34419.1 hypothetical protein JYB87_03975 [Shewanella avicenniae]
MNKLAYSLLASWLLSSSAFAVELGFSGMTQMQADRYLVVQDKKVFQAGERLGIFQLNSAGEQQYTPIVINDWRDSDGQSSDLESVCKLPGTQAQYLLAESGYWDGKFGRIFRVQLQDNHAEVLQVYHLPKLIPSGEHTKGDNFEGMLCTQVGDDTLVIIGERGGSKAYRHGVLRVGVLQADNIDWQRYAEQSYQVKVPKAWRPAKYRSISDLYLDEQGIIWAAATQDGGDNGPFRSLVYAAAKLAQTSHSALFTEPKKQPQWQIEGLKVEALAAPNPHIAHSIMSIGSEDEHYGGVWRPLFAQE